MKVENRIKNHAFEKHVCAVLGIAAAEGCAVFKYQSNSEFSNNAVGLFFPTHPGTNEPPRLNIAMNYSNKKTLFYVAVHEFMHYRQWVAGCTFLYGNDRKNTLLCEYDADRRVAKFISTEYRLPNFNERQFIIDTNRYIEGLKYEFHHLNSLTIKTAARARSVAVPDRWYSHRELLAPISGENIIAFDKYYMRQQR